MSQIQVKSEAEIRVVTVSVLGAIDDGELIGLYQELENSASIISGYSLLLDLREGSGEKVTTEGVRSLAGRTLPLAVDTRVAIVVPNDFGFGLARMYEQHRGERTSELRVFRDIDDAYRWIEEAAE